MILFVEGKVDNGLLFDLLDAIVLLAGKFIQIIVDYLADFFLLVVDDVTIFLSLTKCLVL